jgi:hypothetical protein
MKSVTELRTNTEAPIAVGGRAFHCSCAIFGSRSDACGLEGGWVAMGLFPDGDQSAEPVPLGGLLSQLSQLAGDEPGLVGSGGRGVAGAGSLQTEEAVGQVDPQPVTQQAGQAAHRSFLAPIAHRAMLFHPRQNVRHQMTLLRPRQPARPQLLKVSAGLLRKSSDAGHGKRDLLGVVTPRSYPPSSLPALPLFLHTRKNA